MEDECRKGADRVALWCGIPVGLDLKVDVALSSTRLCGHFAFVPCHSERREESEVWEPDVMCNDFRFFTPLRCAQNDRKEMAAFRMTGKGRCVQNNKIGEPFRKDGMNLLLRSKTLRV